MELRSRTFLGTVRLSSKYFCVHSTSTCSMFLDWQSGGGWEKAFEDGDELFSDTARHSVEADNSKTRIFKEHISVTTVGQVVEKRAKHHEVSQDKDTDATRHSQFECHLIRPSLRSSFQRQFCSLLLFMMQISIHFSLILCIFSYKTTDYSLMSTSNSTFSQETTATLLLFDSSVSWKTCERIYPSREAWVLEERRQTQEAVDIVLNDSVSCDVFETSSLSWKKNDDDDGRCR